MDGRLTPILDCDSMVILLFQWHPESSLRHSFTIYAYQFIPEELRCIMIYVVSIGGVA